MEKIHVGLRNQAGGVCTLDNFEEEVTGVVGIIDVIEVAPMLIGDEVAAYGLDSLEEEENGSINFLVHDKINFRIITLYKFLIRNSSCFSS